MTRLEPIAQCEILRDALPTQLAVGDTSSSHPESEITAVKINTHTEDTAAYAAVNIGGVSKRII